MEKRADRIKNATLTVLGVFYIVIGILAYYNGIRNLGINQVFWFSYTALVLIGVGLLTKNPWIIASQVCIISIPYIIWNTDFFYHLLTSHSLWGITDYFFTSRDSLSNLITIQHVFSVPISLLGIYWIKLKDKERDFWKFSVIEIVLFYIVVRAINQPLENVNCVFTNCLPFHVPEPFYAIGWFAVYGLMIFLTWMFLTKVKVFNQ